MNLTVTYLNPDGTVGVLNTDTNHVAFYSTGLVFNDGTNQNYTFQPWARILRIVSNPTIPTYQ